MNICIKDKISHDDAERKSKSAILFLILTVFTATIIAGCISSEDEGVKISRDIGLSAGSAVKNQTDIQRIQWTVSIANTGSRTAENVRSEIIFHPAVVSRLITFETDTVPLGDLEPDVWKGFKDNATFDAIGLSKHDIEEWEQLVKFKVIWEENGRTFEKTFPEARK